MKILSYTEVGEYLHVLTDNPGRPVFVYPVHRFGSLGNLQLEIERSISSEQFRSDVIAGRMQLLKQELDVEVAKNASK